jgi:hypothetical protein
MNTFKSFFESTAVTSSNKVINLYEGIEHIEALPHKDFISAIRNIANFIASEKLDGSNLTFGFTNEGHFYTSREAKGGQRFFMDSDYQNIAANNGNKSAHLALKKMEPLLKSIMENGDACEVELLYGRQPNAIVYGSNYIAFLRMIVGDNKNDPDQSKVKKLGDTLKGKISTIKVPIVTTYDGVKLVHENAEHKWKFSSVSYIGGHHFKKVDVNKELQEFEEWLNEKHPTGYKNKDLLEIKLPSVPKEIRAEVKKARAEAIKTSQHTFMLPIKEKYLNAVMRKIKPALRDIEVNPDEDIGIEGAVFLDPKTQKQFKIVDKSLFTTVNMFNHSIRNEIKSATRGRPKFEGATLGLEGDIFNNMLLHIAGAVGIPSLAHISGIKRTLTKYKGANRQETLRNFVSDFKVKEPNSLKTHVKAALDQGITQLNSSLQNYNKNWKQFRTTLETGKEIGYTDEIHKRTLMVFAETRKQIQDMANKIDQAKTLEDIAMILYGDRLRLIH